MLALHGLLDLYGKLDFSALYFSSHLLDRSLIGIDAKGDLSNSFLQIGDRLIVGFQFGHDLSLEIIHPGPRLKELDLGLSRVSSFNTSDKGGSGWGTGELPLAGDRRVAGIFGALEGIW